MFLSSINTDRKSNMRQAPLAPNGAWLSYEPKMNTVP